MITPVFKLTQDDQFVYVDIHSPHAKVAEAEVDFDGVEVKFFAHPYFLRIHLPHKVTHDGREKVTWDYGKGTFNVILPKETPSLHFPDLEMISSLIATPRHKQSGRLLIEEVPSHEDMNPEDDDDLEIDWTFEPESTTMTASVGELLDQLKSHQDITSSLLGLTIDEMAVKKYGFANSRSGVFKKLGEESTLIIDVKDPESKSSIDRRRERIEDEDDKFDSDFYLSCLMEPSDLLHNMMNSVPIWRTNEGKVIELSDNELYVLKDLPFRKFLLDKLDKKRVILSMIDLLYAFCYERRFNGGDDQDLNPESDHNMQRLSSTLSWLDSFTSLQEVVISCIRRTLIFAIERDFNLAIEVFRDVISLLKGTSSSSSAGGSKVHLLRCLLQMRESFSNDRHLLNDLYITDYCIWIQQVKQDTMTKVGDSLEVIINRVNKSHLNLDLNLLEEAAHECLLNQ